MANPSDIPKVPRDGSVLFYDNGGASGSNTFTASYINGDFSGNLGAKAEEIDLFVRGKWKGTRKGNDPILEGSFTLPLMQFTNEGQDVILDVLDGRGNIVRAAGSNWTKYTTKIEEWNVGMRFLIEGTDNGDSVDHYVDLPGVQFTWEFGESDGAIDSINVTWRFKDYDNLTFSGPAAA